MPTARPRSPLFRALGANEPPQEVTIAGEHFTLAELYKHDSWAATARYTGRAQSIVCKFNRVQPILGLPTASLGRRLADRERRALERLADLPEIPNALGPVYAHGKLLRNAVARSYVAGHPLAKNEQVGPEFFATLQRVLAEMHRRGIAYVDLHKRENVIVGDDGRPYLVDFQICFDVTHTRVKWIPGVQRIFEGLCTGDRYHLSKHVHNAAAVGEAPVPEIPLWLQLHRVVAVPFRTLRRRLLVARGVRLGRGSVTTEVFAEDAVRRESANQAA